MHDDDDDDDGVSFGMTSEVIARRSNYLVFPASQSEELNTSWSASTAIIS